MNNEQNYLIVIGKITGAFGIKGWVKIHSYSVPEDNLLHYSNLLLRAGDEFIPIKINQYQAHNKGFVASIDLISDRNQAELYRGSMLYINKSDLPEPNTDEYYWHDLIGSTALNKDFKEIGTVVNMTETPAHDILIVKDSYGKEHWIPFVLNTTIIDVDINSKKIIIDWDIHYISDDKS